MPDTYLTKYGSVWGLVPRTHGTVYWVSPTEAYPIDGRDNIASDNNDGQTPQTALLTVDAAVSAADNAGDVVVLLPGTHTPTTQLTPASGVTIMGLSGRNPFRQRATLGPNSDAVNQVVLALSNDRVSVLNLNIVGSTAAIAVSASGDGHYISGCYFDMVTPAANAGTIALELRGDHAVVERCVFESDGAQGPAIDLENNAELLVRDCVFTLSAGTWAESVELTGSVLTVFDRCTWVTQAAAAITVGIDGTGASLGDGVFVQRCRFGAGVATPLDGFGAGEANIAENYSFEVGAGSGGALITAITS